MLSQQKRCKYFALLPAGGGKRSAAERQKEDRLSAVLFFGGDGEIRILPESENAVKYD